MTELEKGGAIVSSTPALTDVRVDNGLAQRNAVAIAVLRSFIENDRFGQEVSWRCPKESLDEQRAASQKLLP